MTETLPTSIEKIIEVFHEQKELLPSTIERAIQEADVRAEQLEDWVDYDHPKSDGYGRKLVYKEDHFEIMVMSWMPGDFSAIHDHGFTQFGAVQIFGSADHAIFSIEENELKTVSRWETAYGDTVPVNHDLIHQMGNAGTKPFISLHVYGTTKQTEYVTGEARLFDLHQQKILRSNGGAFINLPKNEIVKLEDGFSGDFITKLRFDIEFCYQELKAGKEPDTLTTQLNAVFNPDNRKQLIAYLEKIVDVNTGKVLNHKNWVTLQLEMKALSRLQERLRKKDQKTDPFDEYAPLYDAIIGHNSLDFQQGYLKFLNQKIGFDLHSARILSIGCGTGLVEQWILDAYKKETNDLLGLDIAESMVAIASKRIKAIQQNVLEFDPKQAFDLVFTGLNVFQYLSADTFTSAIEKAAALTNPGGYFIGDFITPDHMRWYPNVMYSSDKKVISLRTPNLIKSQPLDQQESEIINVSFLSGEMHAFYAGKHRRILPSIQQVADLFRKYFGSVAQLYDAVTLVPIQRTDVTCESTRYIVIIKKEKDR